MRMTATGLQICVMRGPLLTKVARLIGFSMPALAQGGGKSESV